jgi:hypothetical protein
MPAPNRTSVRRPAGGRRSAAQAGLTDFVSSQRGTDHTINMNHQFNNLMELLGPSARRSSRHLFTFQGVRQAIRNQYRDIDIEWPSSREYHDLDLFIRDIHDPLYGELLSLWNEYHGVGFSLTVHVTMLRNWTEYSENSQDFTFPIHSGWYNIATYQDLLHFLRAALGDIIKGVEEYTVNGSGWTLVEISSAEIQVQSVQPSRALRGGGGQMHLLNRPGSSYIGLPQWIINKRCCVNIQNTDDRCFEYALEYAYQFKNGIHPRDNDNRPSFYNTQKRFNFGDIAFPVHITDVSEFEKLNWDQYRLGINVYYANPDDLSQYLAVQHHSQKAEEADTDASIWIVNLLFLSQKDKKTGGFIHNHWVFIKNMDALLSRSDVKKWGKRPRCFRCLQSFPTESKLKMHKEMCLQHPAQVPRLPEMMYANKYFQDHHKQVRKPCAIYCDFEAFLVPYPGEKGSRGSKKEDNHSEYHVPASYAAYTVFHGHPEWSNFKLEKYEEKDFRTEEADPLRPDFIPSPFVKTDIAARLLTYLASEKIRIDSILKDHYQFPLDASYRDANNEDCVICGLGLKTGIMPHWSKTNYRKEEDFNVKSNYWQRVNTIRYKKIMQDRHLQAILLKENRRPVPAWDPTRPSDNYIGHAHLACAYHIGEYRKIPVFFHNLSGYDSHFILQSLDISLFDPIDPQNENEKAIAVTKPGNRSRFSCIPLSGKNKFMSFAVGGLQFLDSMKFSDGSLEALTDSLKTDKRGLDGFEHMKWALQRVFCPQRNIPYSHELLGLLVSKGYFPYEYFIHPGKFLDRNLPPRESFYSKLKDEEVKPEKYEYALQVWNKTKCETMADYHDLYLMQDVMLLADYMERFRTTCLEIDQLDPAWYHSLPGYSFDCCLKSASKIHSNRLREVPFKINLFFRGQEDMFEFAEDSIRGGICITPGRYAKANHKYLGPDHFDPSKDSHYIVYYDANNLYGYAMTCPLPISDYKWIKKEDRPILLDKVLSGEITDTSPIGYILEIDGEFPEGVQDYLADFPPAPHKLAIPEEWLSPYSRRLHEKMGTKHDSRSTKLICDFGPRKAYKVYYKTLRLYCQLGFKVTACTRILSFKQKCWMKSFIETNTLKRRACKEAQDEIGSALYKLKNNSSYGKFIEDKRKRQEVIAITDRLQPKAQWHPLAQDRVIVSNELVFVFLRNGLADLDSPNIVGSVILDHSKWLMYHFYYNVMKATYQERVRLIMTDTDSLVMDIQTDDLMADFKEKKLMDWFDFSEWSDTVPYHGGGYRDTKNNAVIGKFKDELAKKSHYIREIVSLRPKLYSLDLLSVDGKLANDPSKQRKAKGVNKAVKDKISHEKFVDCLTFEDEGRDFDISPAKMIGFRVDDYHMITTDEITKETLSPNDTKCFLINAYESVPFGYYDIPTILSSL